MAEGSSPIYVSLLEANGRCNVFGVVKFSKVPTKSKGTDYCMTLSITDESLSSHDKVICMLFGKTLDSFPTIAVGDVVRFHRLILESFNGKLQGRMGPGSSWLVVRSDVEKPQTSSKQFTYTEDHKKRIKELQVWAKSHLLKETTLSTIATLVPQEYCDLLCQVVGTRVEVENECFVARVWDGTRPIHPIVATKNELEDVDTELEKKSASMTVDIWLYDDHFQSCLRIKPGQFLKLCNLHAALAKGVINESNVAFPALELTIHRGTSYGRGILFLEPGSSDACIVKQRLEKLAYDRGLTGRQSADLNMKKRAAPSQSSSVNMSKRNVPIPGETVSSCDPVPGCSSWNETEVLPTVENRMSCSLSRQNHKDGVAIAVGSGEGTSCGSVESPVKKKRTMSISDEPCATEVIRTLNSSKESSKASLSFSCSMPRDWKKNEHFPSSAASSHDDHSLFSSPEICMLQTASVITGHHFIDRTTIADVLQHNAPYKFRVLATVVDFHPDSSDATHLVYQLCGKCHFLQRLEKKQAQEEKEGTESSKKKAAFLASKLAGCLGGKMANWKPDKIGMKSDSCFKCSTGDSYEPLELTYLLRLVLTDSSGKYLIANLWQDNATKFFNDIKPQEVLEDQNLYQNIIGKLQKLRSSSSKSALSQLDCCIMSYNTSLGVSFQIFDTVLI